jgi:hypothetical protein
MISSIRNYWSDGRGPDLYRYAAMAYGVAVLEFAINSDNFFGLISWFYGKHFDPFFVGMFWWPSIAEPPGRSELQNFT